MTDSPFHPDLQRSARWLPRGGIGPRTIGPIRTLGRLADRRGRGRAEGHDLGTASVRLHEPATRPPRPSPALLWIHGGGMVIGSATQEDDLCRHVADHLGIPVAAVDYRLAPEDPFPAPLEDCHDALAWLAGRDDVDAPARHDDLSGLPPAWIGVGTLDLFHDEDVAYAERLRQAGVDCRLEVVDGAFHGFDRVAARTPVAKAFLATQMEVLATALAADPAPA